jgi:hypothetical protein
VFDLVRAFQESKAACGQLPACLSIGEGDDVNLTDRLAGLGRFCNDGSLDHSVVARDHGRGPGFVFPKTLDPSAVRRQDRDDHKAVLRFGLPHRPELYLEPRGALGWRSSRRASPLARRFAEALEAGGREAISDVVLKHFKTDLFSVLEGGGTTAPTAAARPLSNPDSESAEKREVEFVTFVLNDIQHTWE